jgi:hypothetical protein
MKPKQIIVLSVIFAVLALGIFLKSWVRSADNNTKTVQESSVALAEFDPSKLERILIGRGSQTPSVELIKENGFWKVKSLWNVQADPLKVEKLIEKLHSARGELRGSGKKLFEDFGIQDADAFSIKLFGAQGVLLQDLRIGTKQAGERSFFIRKATSENIYLVEVNMAELLGIYSASDGATSEGPFWTDLSLFNLDPEKVTKITLYLLKGEEKTRVTGLERTIDAKDPLNSSWKFMRKDMRSLPDPDKVLKFIVVMNSLRAQKAVDPDGKGYGLEKPVWQLSVTESGKKTLLNAGPKDEKGEFCYVNRLGDPTVFDLNLSFFNDLNVDDTYFLKEAPAVAKPGKDPSPNVMAGSLQGQEQAT